MTCIQWRSKAARGWFNSNLLALSWTPGYYATACIRHNLKSTILHYGTARSASTRSARVNVALAALTDSESWWQIVRRFVRFDLQKDSWLSREGGSVGGATTVVGGAYVCRQQCNRLYSCLSDCIKRGSDITWNICELKTERRENERGWRSDTCRYTCPTQPAYFSTGYCNSQSDISSAQRPAPLRTRYTKRHNPENNGDILIVPLARLSSHTISSLNELNRK